MTVADPINVGTIETALYTWFVDVTGLTRVIWEEQSKLRPAYPYGTLAWLSGPIAIGPTEPRYGDNPANPVPVGQELRYNMSTPCMMTVSCNAYVSQDTANSASANALNYINRARASLRLETTRTIFKNSGIAYIRSSITRPPTHISDAWISHALLDVTFGCVLTLVEYGTYIDSFRGISTEFEINKIYE